MGGREAPTCRTELQLQQAVCGGGPSWHAPYTTVQAGPRAGGAGRTVMHAQTEREQEPSLAGVVSREGNGPYFAFENSQPVPRPNTPLAWMILLISHGTVCGNPIKPLPFKPTP